MNNSKENQTPKFSVAIQTSKYQQLINNTLGDSERAKRFVAAVSSAVAINEKLKECDAGTILSGALLGESLNLSPSPQLGQYYLVPFDSKSKGKVATFILGYKGYIQLAIRTGKYEKINVLELKEGELISYDPLNEEIFVNMIQDDEVRENTPTIGYYAMFKEITGFKKILYWSKKKMIEHADKYSPAFSKSGYELLLAGKIPEKEKWKYSSHWYQNFDDMAKKTMLRQLISKWGIMSIEMQQAYENDNKTIFDDGRSSYLDDPIPETEPSLEPKKIETKEPNIIETKEPGTKKSKKKADTPVSEVKEVSLDEL